MSTVDPAGAPDGGAADGGVANGGVANGGAAASRPPPPPAPFVLSCVLGAVGLVLLLAGVAADSSTLSVAGVVLGTMSLGAALYWRSLLISAWNEQRRARRGGGAPPSPPGGARPGPG